MVILGGRVSYVVEEKMYVVEATYEYECICWEHLVCSASIKSGYNYALRIMGHPSRRVAILICDGPLKTPAPVIFSFLSPSNGVNEPSV